jgi:hypothetical protein
MSALDQVSNFIKVVVLQGYDQNATLIQLAPGQGALLPNPSSGQYNMVWWNATDYQDPSDDPNVEIVRVTVIATDQLTVTRAQEGTTATQKQNANKTYKLMLGITAKMITDIQAQLSGIPVYNEIVAGSGTTFTLANTPINNSLRVWGNGIRLTPGAQNDYTLSGAVITTVNSYALGSLIADYSH